MQTNSLSRAVDATNSVSARDAEKLAWLEGGKALTPWTTPWPHHSAPWDIASLAQLDLHASYTQAVAGSGEFPQRRIGYSPAVTGREAGAWLEGSLKGYPCAEGGLLADGTLIYRQSHRHQTLRLTPQPEHGILISRPEHVPDRLYLVADGDQEPHLWSADAVRLAVVACNRPMPVDWIRGVAIRRLDGTIRFERGGAPYSPIRVLTATPTATATVVGLGTPCANCQRFASEHANWYWAPCTAYTEA